MTLAKTYAHVSYRTAIIAERFQADHNGQVLPLAGADQRGTNWPGTTSSRLAASFDGGFVF